MSGKEDNDSKESKEPDYDEDKDQIEEKQEEETGNFWSKHLSSKAQS